MSTGEASIAPLKRAMRVASRILVVLCLASAAAEQPPLASVKRICVEPFGTAAHAAEARELALSSLFAAKKFAVTEICENADAVLKGTASERSNQRMRSEGGSATMRRGAGAARDGLGAIAAAGVGDSERIFSSDMQRRATVTLRLVSPSGDVLWAHTAESAGGKAKSAISDAVDRAIRQLVKDIEKEAKAPAPK